jgi:hypothetical protein
MFGQRRVAKRIGQFRLVGGMLKRRGVGQTENNVALGLSQGGGHSRRVRQIVRYCFASLSAKQSFHEMPKLGGCLHLRPSAGFIIA